MAYTEIKEQNGKKYYYRVLSFREGKRVRKKRIYLGVNLEKKKLALGENNADKELLLLYTLLNNRVLFLKSYNLCNYHRMLTELLFRQTDVASKLLPNRNLYFQLEHLLGKQKTKSIATDFLAHPLPNLLHQYYLKIFLQIAFQPKLKSL